ncbi:phosphoribosyltransferase [Nocardia brasiliensis]|uniref:Phosphoribosyltransferase n=1 Tax=Nocardia brasiliensis TaxID=37326 RepID=A0A6G9XP19_NOCBR|nr:phosphoribosyltransferase family protein [Nocardia brasiliensis]QIS02646.1 phosphoribosyltransferase [Nocardia brasiliensis]
MDRTARSGDHSGRRTHQRSLFLDRRDAGRRLAYQLQAFRGPDVVTLGVPRGGLAVAYEVAAALRVPLDTVVVNKLRVPYRPDLTFGAVAEHDTKLIDEVVVRGAMLTAAEITAAERHGSDRLRRRCQRFHPHGRRAELHGRTALVIDDGVRTGITARTACQAAYRRGAVRVVLAVPVAPHRIARTLSYYADKVVCLETPAQIRTIGQAYQRFDTLTDTEVDGLLRGDTASPRMGPRNHEAGRGTTT